MGSSTRNNSQPPVMPQPPQGMQVPYGEASPAMPIEAQYASYLPTDGAQMATGLTPQMMLGMEGLKDPAALQAEANKAALAEAMAAAPAAAPKQPTIDDLMKMLGKIPGNGFGQNSGGFAGRGGGYDRGIG